MPARRRRLSAPAAASRSRTSTSSRRAARTGSRSRSRSRSRDHSLPRSLPRHARPPGIKLVKVDPGVGWARWLDFCGPCETSRDKGSCRRARSQVMCADHPLDKEAKWTWGMGEGAPGQV
ncbi:hypothetical protein ElyMa_000416300 [Elysia marginata]|uniref:Uncharacterized protein n=1 Tax=Elysia marginata TaxID=1093978 RepID=A0AAV4FKX9_9GAST|nr:hypothetical protein ElyMa_000416300 [Elysia marginata]